MTQLVPPRSSRLAIRPATTLPSRPGNEFSCQPTYESAIRSTTSRPPGSSTPAAFSARLPDRVPEPGAERDDQFQRAGDAEDHADAVAVEGALGRP